MPVRRHAWFRSNLLVLAAALSITPAWFVPASAADARPTFGEVVAVKDGVIWIIDAHGRRAHLLVAGYSPRWSPDGTRIAYARAVGHEWQVWTMDHEGKAQEQVTPTGMNAVEPAWSPDGRRIAFSKLVLDAPDGYRHRDIAVTSSAGGGTPRTVVMAPREAYADTYLDGARFTPDGASLVMTEVDQVPYDKASFELVKARAAGGSPLHELDFGKGSSWYKDGADVSPSGRIVFMTDLGINEDYVEWRYTIAVGDERGRALTVVADDGPQRSCLDPTWSPDGNWIMFQRGSDGKLAVIAADGSRQHLFGRGFQFFATPDWNRRTA